MEERKLIRLGNSSFAIALPKGWIDKSGLKKGDKVSIVPDNNGGLVIGSDIGGAEKTKEIILDLNDKEEKQLQIELVGAYLRDNNIFRIKNNIPNLKKKHIKELVKNLMSFEILEENSEEIRVKDMFDIKEANIKNFIRRMDNIVRSFFEDLSPIIESGKSNKKISNEMYESDREVTKMHLLISRIFMKSLINPSVLYSLKLNYWDLFNDWWVAKYIESIGDGLKVTAKKIEAQPIKEKEKLFSLFNKIKDNYFTTMGAYYKKDKSMIRGVMDNNKKLIEECEENTTKNIRITQIKEGLKTIQKDIFEIARMTMYTIE